METGYCYNILLCIRGKKEDLAKCLVTMMRIGRRE